MNLDELTDFDAWTDVRLALAPWTIAYDAQRTLGLARCEQGVYVYEPPNAWRARNRRQRHRLGFRSVHTPQGVPTWDWTVPADVVNAEVKARFDDGSNSLSVLPVVQRLREIRVTDRLV